MADGTLCWMTRRATMQSFPLLIPLEAVRQRRTLLALVREPRDEQGERLAVAGHLQRAGVHGLEARVADQARGGRFRVVIVAAVDEAGAGVAVPRLEHGEQHLARHGAEGGDDTRAGRLLRELLGA